MIRTSFRLEAFPGDVLRGDVRIPEGAPPRSAVVVMHGFKGFKDWGFFPHLCESLVADGHAVVSFNSSHNGIGEDLETFTELERFGANTFSRELDELRFVLSRTLEGGDLLPSPPERLGLVGHSRGGGQAILAASEESRVDALATWAAVSHYDRWSDATKAGWRANGRIFVQNARTGQQMPLDLTLLDDYEENRRRLDIGAAATELRTPWLIVHGTNDMTVPADEGRDLAGAAPNGSLVLVEGAGHTFEARHPFQGPTPELDAALDATRAHFRRHLVD